MASENDNNADNLTTDACPSPPRDEKPFNVEFTEEVKRDEAKSESNTHSRTKKKKSKSRQVPSQAVANVINMNNCNGVHIGSVITYNMGKSQKLDDTEGKEIVKTKAICDLLDQTDSVTKDVISFVSDHIGKNWRVVARSLDYSDGQIHQFYETHLVVGIREVVYQILLDWIQNKPEEATVGRLFTALWNAFEKDVVERMAHKETATK